MNEHLYILIMAGGEGTRFFPVSTPEKPKQFLSFWGERTFIQQTFDRFTGLVPTENVYLATNDKYIDIVKEQLPEVPHENIIGEPEKKNTAPCIAFASKIISEIDKDAVIVVLPSDHLITKQDEFRKVIERAIYIATTRDVLVTLGIQPSWPADCYGYIKVDRLIEDDPDGKWPVYTVDKFIEKPSVDVASEYIKDDKYVWNSGMFVWKAGFVLNQVEKYLPKMKNLLDQFGSMDQIKDFFRQTEGISIDYGIMERSDRVVSVPCSIGWSDIGSWESLYQLEKNNLVELEPHIAEIMREKVPEARNL